MFFACLEDGKMKTDFLLNRLQIVESSELVRLGILLANTLAKDQERPRERKYGRKEKQQKWTVSQIKMRMEIEN